MTKLLDAELLPYAYQVGGHSKADGLPASLTDRHGRFLKKLQAGERGTREVAFYAALEQARQSTAVATAAGEAAGDAPHACCSSSSSSANVMQELAKWVPKSYGTRPVGGSGAQYLVIEDVTAGYKQPCILDIKIGHRTWYPWADEHLQHKYKSKDSATTQSSLGFRVCGLLVHNSSTGAVWRVDRHWGKELTDDTVHTAFTRYAENGHISLADLLQGRDRLLDQLESLAATASRQDVWHMYSTSVLVVYEGAATSAADAKLMVRLIDFAHTFPTTTNMTTTTAASATTTEAAAAPAAAAAAAARNSNVEGCSDSNGSHVVGPSGVDENFLGGLQSLIRVLKQLLVQQVEQQ